MFFFKIITDLRSHLYFLISNKTMKVVTLVFNYVIYFFMCYDEAVKLTHTMRGGFGPLQSF